MNVEIAGKRYEIKKIQVQDFLNEENLVPISIFSIGKKQINSKHEQLYAELLNNNNEKTPEQLERELNESATCMAIILSKCCLGLGIVDKEFVKNNFDESSLAFMTILSISIGRLSVLDISENAAIYIDTIAKRYSKTPIDIVYPNGCNNDLYSFLFNQFICSIGIKRDNQQIEQQNRAMRQRNGR